MTNCLAAFFIVHSNRSRKAFEALIENWCGILVSANYVVYRNWVNHRQVCLAHLIRKAGGQKQVELILYALDAAASAI
jgi:transposase